MGGLSTLLSPTSSSASTSIGTITFSTFISNSNNSTALISSHNNPHFTAESSSAGISDYVCHAEPPRSASFDCEDGRHGGLSNGDPESMNGQVFAPVDPDSGLGVRSVTTPLVAVQGHSRAEPFVDESKSPPIDTGQTRARGKSPQSTMTPPMPRNKRYLHESMQQPSNNISLAPATYTTSITTSAGSSSSNASASSPSSSNASSSSPSVSDASKTVRTTHWKKNSALKLKQVINHFFLLKFFISNIYNLQIR